MSLSLTRQATVDVDQIADDVHDSQGTDASRRVIEALTQHLDRLGAMPLMGRTRDHDLGSGRRSTLFQGYVIVHRVEGGDAIILRVVHGRRDLSSISFDG